MKHNLKNIYVALFLQNLFERQIWMKDLKACQAELKLLYMLLK